MPADPVRGRRWADHRRTSEATAWMYCTSSPWRDLPGRLGSVQTAHKRLLRWAMDGTWERILDAVLAEAEGADEIGWTVVSRLHGLPAHQHAAGARRRGLQGRPNPETTRWDARAAAWARRSIPPATTMRTPWTLASPPARQAMPLAFEVIMAAIRVPRSGPDRPCALIPSDPEPPSPTRNPRGHPPAVRPGRPPAAVRRRRRSPSDFRRGVVQAAQRG